jgi:hypothetical protein
MNPQFRRLRGNAKPEVLAVTLPKRAPIPTQNPTTKIPGFRSWTFRFRWIRGRVLRSLQLSEFQQKIATEPAGKSARWFSQNVGLGYPTLDRESAR